LKHKLRILFKDLKDGKKINKQDIEPYFKNIHFVSQILGSYFVAKETATILRQVVSISRWRDAHVLIDIVTQVGARLASAQPNGIFLIITTPVYICMHIN
jgi:hypothetical protein